MDSQRRTDTVPAAGADHPSARALGRASGWALGWVYRPVNRPLAVLDRRGYPATASVLGALYGVIAAGAAGYGVDAAAVHLPVVLTVVLGLPAVFVVLAAKVCLIAAVPALALAVAVDGGQRKAGGAQ